MDPPTTRPLPPISTAKWLCRAATPRGRTGRRKPAAGPLAQAVRSIMTRERSSGKLENAPMEEAASSEALRFASNAARIRPLEAYGRGRVCSVITSQS